MMGKRRARKEKQIQATQKSKLFETIGLRLRLKTFGCFILGTMFGLYIVHWFVTVLPGPEIAATVFGLRGTTPQTAGCVYHMVVVASDEAIEYIYLKLQFPSKINDFKVGWPQESQSKTAGRSSIQAWAAGKDADGNCSIKGASINNTTDVQSSAAGNMIAIHSSKLPPKARIMGAVATTEGKSAIKPIPTSVYSEGAYEYIRLGQMVRKVLAVTDKGITDAK